MGDVSRESFGAVKLKPLRREDFGAVAGPMPGSISPEAAYGTIDELGPLDPLTIGAGRTADQIIAGVKQGAAAIPHLLASEDKKPAFQDKLDALAAEQQEKDQAYAPLQQKHPIATGVGQALPYLAVPSSMGTMGQMATVGSLEGLKYGSNEDRVTRALSGSLLQGTGNLVAKGGAALINPVVPGGISQTQAQALKDAISLGIKPRLSQITGSKYASQLEDFAANTPGGAGTMAEFNSANQRAINKVGTEAIGQKGYSELSPTVLSNASRDLGAVFEDIKALGKVNVGGRQVLPIQVNADVGTAADKVLAVQSKLPSEMQNGDVISLAQKARQLASLKGRIDGESYQLIRSNLSDAAHTAFSGGSSTAGKAYQAMLKALDDSAENSLRQSGNTLLAEQLRQVRPQYAALQTIEKGRVAAGGNLNPQLLGGAMRTNNPKMMREADASNNPLLAVARYGEDFPPLREGSQTYTRDVVSSPISTAVKAPFAWLASKATTSPLALTYPSVFGGTKAAELAALLSKPATRLGVVGAGNILKNALMTPIPKVAE